MSKKNLAIIGASYLQVPLIEKAKQMGFVTHVFAWKANDVGESLADHFYPISIIEKERILKKCQEIGICGICSIASDLATITVNYVSEKMGLAGNSAECTLNSTNKHLMRICFEKNGDPSPKSILVDRDTDLSSISLSFPLIVKPTDRSGSRAITKVENFSQLETAREYAISESFEKKCLIEEYAEGDEFSVEGLSYLGEHHILAITKKETTGSPNYIETGHTEPAALDEKTAEDVKSVVKHALNSLGVTNSASHSEIKIDKDGVIRIIEIGARMGGDCIGSDLVFYSTGIDFVKAVIQVACGNRPDLTSVRKPVSVSVRYILNDSDLVDYKELCKHEPERIIKTIYLKPELINKCTNSSDRAGCYIIKAKE